jgi:phage shock protein PspC (stress-responsive transcriptional regulator)
MAELLTERGISGDKVVLLEDIVFLKEQLGEPQDFKDDTASDEVSDSDNTAEQSGPRRLFRDTDNAMIAGVSSGLAAYFGIDAVIVRLIFVITLFWGGAGLLAYILLWLVVPEAKTNSERLQMRGKAVTVDSLKQVVDRADVQGAAGRASRAFGRFIEKSSIVLLAMIGVGFVIAGVVTFLIVAVTGCYLLISGGQVAGEVIYPVGAKAVISLVCAAIVGLIVAIAMLFTGVAMIRRRWTVPGWVGASVLGVSIVAASIGTALAFDIAPGIREKYRSMNHTQTYSMAPFTDLKVVGKDESTFEYKPSSTYFVEVQYFGTTKRDTDISKQVKDGVLTVDTTKYKAAGECDFVCLYGDNTVRVIVHAPKLDSVSVDGPNTYFFSEQRLNQDKLRITATNNNSVDIQGMTAASITAKKIGVDKEVILEGMRPAVYEGSSAIRFSNDGLISSDNVSGVFTIEDRIACDEYQPLVYLDVMPERVVIGDKTIQSQDELMDLRSANKNTNYNCVVVRANE